MPKKVLVTGISGFVGSFLKAELESNSYEVIGLDRLSGHGVIECDITDAGLTKSAVHKAMPDMVIHLAGFSSVAKSFEQPELCRKINVDGTRNLLDAVASLGGAVRVLVISSSDVYGEPKYNPIDEKHPLMAMSPYAESRIEQERLCLSYSKRVPIVISRSFSHTGKGQPPVFVIPSFRKQVEEAPDGGTVYVGNLNVVRDISKVEDVVTAYCVLLERGVTGEVYNIGSGVGYKLKDVLDKFIQESGKQLKIEVDPARLRKHDIMKIVCDNTKIRKLEVNIRGFMG